jgi:hypothetical protein
LVKKYRKISKWYPNFIIEPILKKHPEWTLEQTEQFMLLSDAVIKYVAAQALEDGLSIDR